MAQFGVKASFIEEEFIADIEGEFSSVVYFFLYAYLIFMFL